MVSNNQTTATNNENEIDFKEVFTTLSRYKLSIFIVTTLVAIFAVVLAYFSPNIYQTNTTIEIITEQGRRAAPPTDYMTVALGMDSSNIDNEVEMLQSRFNTSKALLNLNIGTRYFTKQQFKTVELYKSSPFVVTSEFLTEKAQASPFQIIPLSEDRFRLIIKPSLTQKIKNKIRSYIAPLPEKDKPIYYDEAHYYGKPISTPWFNITIQKVYQLENEYYSFSIMPNDKMYDFILENLSVVPIAEFASIISLSFEDNVPLRAKEILDAVANAYMQEKHNTKTGSAQRKLDFIDKQLQAINRTLQNSATSLQSFKATNIVVNLEDKAALTAEKMSDLESQRYELDMQISVLDNILNYIESHKDIGGIDIGSQQLTPTINAVILRIQEANTLRTSLLVDYTELHPDVLKVTEQLITLKKSLNETIKSSLRGIKKRKHTLSSIINKHKKELEAFPEQQKQLTQLTRNFMVNEKIYSYLLEKRAETAIVESSTVSETRILDAALVPKKPIKPKRAIMVIIGVVLGLIFGVALALLRNFLDDTIKAVEDIEKYTDIPLYGAIPLLNSKKKVQPFYEALRVLRTNLEFLQDTGKSKLVTVTSSIPAEGKTTIITELGKVISKSNKKVIILDLDLRRSRAHEKFHLSNHTGMSTLLAGKNSIDEVIQATKHKNLDMITSGPIPPNPSELLMADALKHAINHLFSQYDYVLLDSPPIGLVTDAMIMMRMSDINLIVLKANYSKKEFIKNINRFTQDHHLKNVGIVLSGLDTGEKSGYGYGYGYGYEYDNAYYSEKGEQ